MHSRPWLAALLALALTVATTSHAQQQPAQDPQPVSGLRCPAGDPGIGGAV
jgi:hypothetical protein